MSSSGRAEDTYRVGTKCAGPVCQFTGFKCSCGTDCRSCNVPRIEGEASAPEAI